MDTYRRYCTTLELHCTELHIALWVLPELNSVGFQGITQRLRLHCTALHCTALHCMDCCKVPSLESDAVLDTPCTAQVQHDAKCSLSGSGSELWALHCTALHCTAHCTLCTAPACLWRSPPHHAAQCCTPQYSGVQSSAVHRQQCPPPQHAHHAVHRLQCRASLRHYNAMMH
jgi:hypothetical protein